MRHKKNNYPLFTNVEIIDIAADGKAIAKVQKTSDDGEVRNLIILVSKVVPGDIADVQIINKRKKMFEGIPVKFHKYSEKRTEAFCSHFGICGGCKWQDMAYDAQLFYKQKQVVDALQRIGKVELPEINQIIPSENIQYYRNKLEFTFSDTRWLTKEEMDIEEKNTNALGFHVPGRFDKIVDLSECYLQGEPSNSIRLALKEYADINKLSFYNARSHEGYLRNVIVRTSTTGEVMVIVIFGYDEKESREALLNFLDDKFPEITSLLYIVNKKFNDSITDQDAIPYKGNDFIFEEMENLKFKIGPKSFYQTNSQQAYTLYKISREYANLQGNEIAYDLYTGTGTIANFIAHNVKKVVGLEYVPEAIEDAKVNSTINNITNSTFYAGDIKDLLTPEFVETNGMPDIMIIDPPRAGMHKDVVSSVMNIAPQRIVYISCNPATQARDINLMDEKYKVIKVQPVDMFPHTSHVENIVLLEKK